MNGGAERHASPTGDATPAGQRIHLQATDTTDGVASLTTGSPPSQAGFEVSCPGCASPEGVRRLMWASGRPLGRVPCHYARKGTWTQVAAPGPGEGS